MNKMASLTLGVSLLGPLVSMCAADISQHNVIWNSPSKDSLDSMPLDIWGLCTEGVLKGGKLESLKVSPKSRAKDIVNWLGKQPPYRPLPAEVPVLK